MIPVSILPSQPVDNAANAAPNSPDDTANTPFDAILSLEALAATCAALDGGAAGSIGEELAAPDGDDRDCDEDADAKGPLAFLASLFSLVPVTTNASAESGESGTDDALELLAQGGGKKGDDSPLSAVLAGTQGTANAADLALAGKVIDATSAADADQRADAVQTDPTAGASRVAEWLSHAPRHVTAANAGDGILTPVRDPRWAEELGTRVTLMVKGAESSASLQLTPVDLGPLDVSVTVKDSQATIHFGAAHAETRALLEASIPRLREMLAAQGFNLLDASVSQGFSRSARSDAPDVSRGEVEPEVEAVTQARIVANGLLDLYA